MKPLKKSAILLLIANPVDILTYFALEYSGLPKNQVIGSGTFLDSARLRGAVAAKAGVAASSIDAYVLGEHGESQVVFSPHDQVDSESLTYSATRSPGLAPTSPVSH